MATPRGSTRRGRSRNAETNLAYRQRRVADDPAYTPCPVCGLKFKSMGHGAHRRQHILNGDIDAELPHECEDCGERYETASQLRDHILRGQKAMKRQPKDNPERAARVAYVNSIAKLPYREFVERLLA